MKRTPVQSKSKSQRLGTLFLAAMSISLSVKAQNTVLTDSTLPYTDADATDQAPTASDLTEQITFSVPMKMRNFTELESRVLKGERISQAEMAAKYYPLTSDFQLVRNWLSSEGFTEEVVDAQNMNVLASGTASQVAESMQVQFIKKQGQGQQSSYLSAIAAPSVPAKIASLIIGINGLQPQHHATAATFVGPQDPTTPVKTTGKQAAIGLYTVSQIIGAYNGNNLPNTGTNQTIVIIGNTIPSSTDIQNFWNYNGITQQSLSNIQYIAVPGTTGTADTDTFEASLDVEWASGMAPTSQIRFYNLKTLTVDKNITQALLKVNNDIASGTLTNVHQLSMSFGEPEAYSTSAYAKTLETDITAIAANGVTVFVSSGDGGSNPNVYEQYNTAAAVGVSLPASAPAATAVGGTSLPGLASNGFAANESAWTYSGGGASIYYAKPSYQSGTNVPADGQRDVPDVAMIADASVRGCIVFWTNPSVPNSTSQGYLAQGTSLGAPIWAGICARINDARTAFGSPVLGNTFNPTVYGLIQTSAVRDIDSGSNGAYSAGPAYNQVTGCGVPRIASFFHSATMPFFTHETDLGGGVYYLAFPGENYFGYYNYVSFPTIYHEDLGYEGVENKTDPNDGIYLYDDATGDTFYTSPSYPFPYLFDFNLNTVLYYYPNTNESGHYTTGPRYFYDYATSSIITK